MLGSRLVCRGVGCARGNKSHPANLVRIQAWRHLACLDALCSHVAGAKPDAGVSEDPAAPDRQIGCCGARRQWRRGAAERRHRRGASSSTAPVGTAERSVRLLGESERGHFPPRLSRHRLPPLALAKSKELFGHPTTGAPLGRCPGRNLRTRLIF